MSIGTIMNEVPTEEEIQKTEAKHPGATCLILGESGSGKTTSLRNCDPETTLLIQPIKKSLPFRRKGWKPWKGREGSIVYVPETPTDPSSSSDPIEDMKPKHGQAARIADWIMNAHKFGKKIVVVDDWQYVMAIAFMQRGLRKGYDKFSEIGQVGWHTLSAATQAAEGVNVYFLAHTATDDQGVVRAKTVGKMIDEKIVVEGLFPIVLRSVVTPQGYFFSVKNSGQDTVKAPMDMFDEETELIDNDLNNLDKVIRDYYAS